MHFLDGYQFYSKEEAQKTIKKVVPKKEQKYFYVEKDEKPSWYSGDKWNQTFTIRVKDYKKIKIVQEPERY